MALRILHELVRLQAAVDADGAPLQPLPIVHRTLASPQCLPHIAQVGPSWSGHRLQGSLGVVTAHRTSYRHALQPLPISTARWPLHSACPRLHR